jgi:hypothetical protein
VDCGFLTMAGTQYEGCSVSDSTLALQNTTSLVVLLCIIWSPSVLLGYAPANGALPRPSVCVTPCVGGAKDHFVPGGGDACLTEEEVALISNRTPMIRS